MAAGDFFAATIKMSMVAGLLRDPLKHEMKTALARKLLIVAGILLIITGLAKVVSQTGMATILDTRDPIIPATMRQVLLAVGAIEILLGVLCFSSKNFRMQGALVAWFATSVLLYRGGLWYVGYTKPCSCIGTLTDVIHVDEEMADKIAKLILCYLLAVGYSFWLNLSPGEVTPQPKNS